MAFIRKIAIVFRYINSFFISKRELNNNMHFDLLKQDGSDYIKQLLEDDKSAMIARFGSVELSCVTEYLNKPSLRSFVKYISHQTESFGYGKSTKYAMHNNAGFFPVTNKNLNQFSQLMLDCMPMVDVLGSWQTNECYFEKELFDAVKVPLGDLEPYFHKNPWSEVLAGKKVLVIHPFEDSIIEQYKKRDLLFKDKRILPDFELQTIKAVQSIAGNSCGFATWFDALQSMKNEIDKRDFDIALIGCGAYGFPLAAYVKSIGKKAVHLGGAVQILFGIKGAGWNDRPEFQQLFNDYWISPNKNEKPKHFNNVESGRYW